MQKDRLTNHLFVGLRHHRLMSRCNYTRLGFLVFALSTMAAAALTLDDYLRDGRVQEGMVAFANPKDNAGRFSLGLLQALDGLQQFSAGSGKLGVSAEALRSGLPFLRIMMAETTPTSGSR